ncbi:MAG: hypothetical protein ACI4XB_03510 [Ruminococcus sp.]
MGKNLKNADLVLRTGKLAFYLVPGNSAYTRMEGFTSLSTSKNPTEYERQYVDEDFKRTDITGYNSAIAYALDRYKGHPVTDDIILIHENEYLGQDAIRSIIQLDMTTAENKGGSTWTAKGKMRDFAVIPDTDGDTTDCMTYSGNFKTRGEMEDVEVVTTDDFQTVSIAGMQTAPYLTSLSIAKTGGASVDLSPAFNKTTERYTIAETGNLTMFAAAESSGYNVTAIYKGSDYDLNGKSASFSNVADGDLIYITVNNGGTGAVNTRTYTIQCSATSTLSLEDDA